MIKICIVTGFCLYSTWLAISTWSQDMVWQDTLSLWKHADRETEKQEQGGDPVIKTFLGNTYHSAADYAGSQGDAGKSRLYLDSAIGCFTKAIEKLPANANIYDNRSAVYLLEQKYGLAIKDADSALAHKPFLASAYLTRGCAYSMDAGTLSLALSDLQKSIVMQPQSDIAWTNLGDTYYQMNLIDSAIYAYNRALSINPQLSAAQENRKMAYGKKMAQ